MYSLTILGRVLKDSYEGAQIDEMLHESCQNNGRIRNSEQSCG